MSLVACVLRSVSMLLLILPLTVKADTLPVQLVPAEVERLDAAKELLNGTFPGLLLTPQGEQKDTDTKLSQPFHAACYAYTARRVTGRSDISLYERRFIVHAPDAATLPLAKRVARLLLLLCGENRERLHHEHPVSTPTVDVWLSRQVAPGVSADAGGEQTGSNIYIYSIFSDRSPIEWTREVAHEYGHYALPGVSGFTAPEEWANGVLGERLFLKWIQEDLEAGRLHADEVPFATPEQIDEYITRQVTPLIRKVARDGIEPRLMGHRDAGGMDYYIGFALYLDTVYGSKALLDALTYTQPGSEGTFIHAPDFLRGALQSLRGATEIAITPPLVGRDKRADTLFIYLPRGEFTVTSEGPLKGWKFDAMQKGIHPVGKDGLIVNVADWRKLSVSLASSPSETPRLIFRRRGAEVE